jgi:hypothetical protein
LTTTQSLISERYANGQVARPEWFSFETDRDGYGKRRSTIFTGIPGARNFGGHVGQIGPRERRELKRKAGRPFCPTSPDSEEHISTTVNQTLILDLDRNLGMPAESRRGGNG